MSGASAGATETELDRFFGRADGLLCIADLDGRLLRVSPAFERFLGYSQAEIVARPQLELVHPDDREATTAASKRLGEGREVVTLENRCRCKDGTHRWVLWNAIPLRDARRVYALAQDITERKLEEEVRRHQSEELQRASRLKSEFLANMSHELRTPLNAVIGFTELVLEDAGPALRPKHAGYLEDVLKSGRSLLALINDILDLARIESGRVTLDLEAVDVRMLIEEAATLVAPTTSVRHITVRTDVRTARRAHADLARVRQVLGKLLSNAAKFSPEGSLIEVGAEDAGANVRFTVRDRGPGIDPDLRTDLFRPFVQGESAFTKRHRGSGLGLAISRSLVEQHGGSIDVVSEIGRGSTFTFTIPASAEEPCKSPRAMAPPSGAGGAGRPLVLVIEDDPSAAQLVREHLESGGYMVTDAGAGRDAVDLARRLQPAAIILDLILDGCQDAGFSLLKTLKGAERTRAIPVVIASVLTEQERGLALGASGYVVKPIARDVLLETVAAARGLRREGPSVALLIDDDPHVAEAVRATLEPAGYRVISAGDGRSGLALAARESPDVFLVDLVLPDLSGVQVLDALATDPRTRGRPAIVLTAADLLEGDRTYLKDRAVYVLGKSEFRGAALLAMVDRALGREPRTPARPAMRSEGGAGA